MGHLVVYAKILPPSCYSHCKNVMSLLKFFFFTVFLLLDFWSKMSLCQVESWETRVSLESSTLKQRVQLCSTTYSHPPLPVCGSNPGLGTWLGFVVSTNLTAARESWRTQLGSHVSWGVGTDGRCGGSGNPPHYLRIPLLFTPRHLPRIVSLCALVSAAGCRGPMAAHQKKTKNRDRSATCTCFPVQTLQVSLTKQNIVISDTENLT